MAMAMYVVHEGEGGRQWARMSVHDCLLHLHVLRNEPPPDSAVVLSVSH